MKNFAKTLISVMFAVACSMAHASYDDMANVKNVTPIYSEQMQQQQVCTTSSYQQPSERSNAGAAIGGLAGALLGNGVGGGNGRIAATAVGAIIGAISGDRVDNRQQVSSNMGTNCHWEQVQGQPRITGYLVTFEYQGRVFQNTMPYDPTQNGGGNIRVAVSVVPR